MRAKQVIRNVVVTFFSQFIGIIIGFVTRKVFINTLGLEMLGIIGVFNNLLAMLGIAELGIGTAITYNLYEPLAEHNEEKVSALMQLYRRVYIQIGCIILGLGSIIMFFIPYFLKDATQNLIFLRSIYLLQVISTALTYFLGHKRILIVSDQKEYICVRYELLIRVFTSIIQILILLNTKNYLIYLVIGLLQVLVSNLIIINKSNKLYPYLNKYKGGYDKYKKVVYRDIKNIGIAKVSNYVYGSTDNLIISSFLGVIPVGQLANYTMIIGVVKGLTEGVMGPIQASIGNMISEVKSKSKTLEVFQVYTFIRFLLASFCITSLITLIQPFITLWLGKKYVLPNTVIILMCIDLYIAIVHGCIWQYINGAGMFLYEKYISIIGMLVNLISSIVLVQVIGVNGVLLGTVIAHLFYWIGRAWVLFKHYFKMSGMRYLKRIIGYTIMTIIEGWLTYKIGASLVQDVNIVGFITLCIICLLVPNILNIAFFYKTEEMRYLRRFISTYISTYSKKRSYEREA